MSLPLVRLLLCVGACACGGDVARPPRRVPAALEVVTDLPSSATAGSIAGTLVVKVTDADAKALSGVLITFAVSRGAGGVYPANDTTKADGTAQTVLTLGTIPGPNEVAAIAAGVPQVRSTMVDGVGGVVQTIALAPRAVRLAPVQDSVVVSATPRDGYGNPTATEVTWTSRDPALVSVTAVGNSAVARVVSRPGRTYLVASSAGATDSTVVTVHDANSSPCSLIATPVALLPGQSIGFESTGLTCVQAPEAAEYLLVAHYNTAVSPASANVNITANGIVPATTPFPAPEWTAQQLARQSAQPVIAQSASPSFETALRERERSNIGPHVAGARAWKRTRGASISALAREGDVTSINVNPFQFCDAPDLRSARVVAITNGTVVLADTDNPAGGFTDAEYRALGVAVDTLITPIDTAAFGTPSDIDGNGRVAILFTRTVNELTPRGSPAGVVLGFYYVRDLLPRQSPFGRCPGSNVSEMFYVLVPDPGGTVSDARSKAYVQSLALSTIAHEYQHLINASRRMYVNDALDISEDVWLNEGLSHMAEELVFYRASKLGSRQNIGAAQIPAGSDARAAIETFQAGNLGRYVQFLRALDSSSPLAANDLLATRGATWALLRYVADRTGASDGDLWRRLVNSRYTGVVNLDAALSMHGMTTLEVLRDWSVAVAADDNAGGLDPEWQQASWNFGSTLPAIGFPFPLSPPALAGGQPNFISLRSGGSAYFRFAVPLNGEALIQVSGGAVPQRGVLLTLMRIR